MVGVLVGLGFGAAQLALLTLGVGLLGGRDLKIWALVVQFFCPLAGLLLCALAFPGQLLSCAVSMSIVLVLGAASVFAAVRVRESHRKKD